MFALSLRNAIAGPSRLRLPIVPSPPMASIRTLSLRSPQSQRPLPSSPILSSTRHFSSTPTNSDKIKSHSGTKKRFFRTASGLFKRAQAGKRHLNTLFSASRINRLGKTKYTTKTQNTMLKKLLPYA